MSTVRVKQRRLAIEVAAADVARLRAAVSPTVDAYARVEGDRLTSDGYGTGAERTLFDRVIGLALTARRAQVAALETAQRSAEARWDAQRTGYELGDRQLVDVLDAEQALYAVRRDLSRARYASYSAQLVLYASAGELDESRLREVDASLR